MQGRPATAMVVGKIRAKRVQDELRGNDIAKHPVTYQGIRCQNVEQKINHRPDQNYTF